MTQHLVTAHGVGLYCRNCGTPATSMMIADPGVLTPLCTAHVRDDRDVRWMKRTEIWVDRIGGRKLIMWETVIDAVLDGNGGALAQTVRAPDGGPPIQLPAASLAGVSWSEWLHDPGAEWKACFDGRRWHLNYTTVT